MLERVTYHGLTSFIYVKSMGRGERNFNKIKKKQNFLCLFDRYLRKAENRQGVILCLMNKPFAIKKLVHQ